jgi:preprotein translocase subunit SecA
MDYLREGISLRGFAQIDPLVAYKNEAYELFTDLMNSIWQDFARMIYHAEVELEMENGAGGVVPPPAVMRPAGSPTKSGSVSYSSGGIDPRAAMAMAAAGTPEELALDAADGDVESVLPPVVEQRRVDETERLGRNDPCWCGSGKKFKKCHGAA